MELSQQEVDGYDNFLEFIKSYNSSGDELLFIIFTGSKLPSGISWCSDCVEAYPVIKENLNKISKKALILTVYVGQREYWKDKKCPFRTNSQTMLNVIPTIIKWGTEKRLEGEQCKNGDLLELLFADED